MKFALIFLLFISFNTFALVCDDAGTLSTLDGRVCLTDELSKEELESLVARKDEILTFCQGCKSPLLETILKDKDASHENKSSYSGAILDEFQKELSFLSIDLMKIRNSYRLNFDPSKAIKSCDFNKNLKKPRCLKGIEADKFDMRISSIKSSLANELVNVLSDGSEKKDGLFDRPEVTACGLNDKDVSNANIRYSESLLSPEFISSLKSFNIPSKTSFKDFLKENLGKKSNLSPEMKKKLQGLKKQTVVLNQNPLFEVLLNDTTKLNLFLKEIGPNDDNSRIVETLYSEKFTNMLGESFSSRCDDVFKKTTKHLDDLLCKNVPYIADELQSMQAVSGTSFKEMTDKEAENEIKTHCAYLNAKRPNAVSFISIREDMVGLNHNNLSDLPLKQFKQEAFKKMFANQQENICNAKADKSICEKDPESENCKMLHFYELGKTDKHYKQMAQASGENINLILRSLVGSGLPTKDGKVDTKAVVLLQSEGILPGGDSSTRPQQQDAGTFFKTVNSGNNGTNATPIPQTKTTQNSATQFKPTTGTTAAVDESSDEDPTSTSKSTTSNNLEDIKKTDKKFSALSDEEQKNILNRLKPKRKAGKSDIKGFSPDAQKDSDPFFANSAEETSAGSFNTRGPASTSTNTAIVPTAQNTSGFKSGNYAKIDPTVVRKDGQYNKALEQANTNDRSPASNPVEETKFALTKNESGLNEIEIKVADESILEKKTPELEKKIQEYLEKSGQSLTGAKKGEAFIVKLGKYKIKVAINDYGAYVATCAKGESIHPEYLAFLSRYFTGIKERVSSRLSMEKIINEESVKRN
jgi:hypothetical protein